LAYASIIGARSDLFLSSYFLKEFFTDKTQNENNS
jgi:hypothetical protein